MGKLTYLALFPIIYLLVTHLLHVFYFAGEVCKCKSNTKLHGKTVIVTGANTGIGKYTAMDLAARGARVILAGRSAQRTLPVVEEIKRKTGNAQVLFMGLDLASFDSIQRFSEEFLKNEERLNILINNAGMVSTSDEIQLTEDGIEITLMVNHLGHMFLTQNLLNILKKSGPGSRVVTLSSMSHDFANPNAFKNLDDLKVDGAADVVSGEWPYSQVIHKSAAMRYTNSKLANVLFSKELSNRLAGSGVTTYSLHPGAIVTELYKDISGLGRKNGIIQTMMDLPEYIKTLTFPFKTMVEGAQTSICCAVNEELASESGQYYSDCVAKHVSRRELYGDYPAKFWGWSEGLIREAMSKRSRK